MATLQLALRAHLPTPLLGHCCSHITSNCPATIQGICCNKGPLHSTIPSAWNHLPSSRLHSNSTFKGANAHYLAFSTLHTPSNILMYFICLSPSLSLSRIWASTGIRICFVHWFFFSILRTMPGTKKALNKNLLNKRLNEWMNPE